MGGFSNAVLGGASKLIRKAIESPNFQHLVSGWSVNNDGSAEFNNVTVRGTLSGSTIVIPDGATRGPYIIIDQTGIRAYDANNQLYFDLDGTTPGNSEIVFPPGAGTGARIVINSSGVTVYDNNNNAAIQLAKAIYGGGSQFVLDNASILWNDFGGLTLEQIKAGQAVMPDGNTYTGVEIVTADIGGNTGNVLVSNTTAGKSVVVADGFYAKGMNKPLAAMAGTKSVTFNAQNSQTVAIAFGNALPAAPAGAVVTSNDGANFDLVCSAYNFTTTGFTIRLAQKSGSNITGTFQISWMVFE